MRLIYKHIVLFWIVLYPFFIIAQNVVDNTIPVITLIGTNIIKEVSNKPYIDSGATAFDDVDGDISDRIQKGGDTVYGNIPGVYLITYNVFDTSGNEALEITRTVTITVDTTAPVITLVGEAFIFLRLGMPYVEKGVTVFDNFEKSLTVTIGGDIVNTNIVGTYKVTYDISDASGNDTETVVRTIKVFTDSLTQKDTVRKKVQDITRDAQPVLREIDVTKTNATTLIKETNKVTNTLENKVVKETSNHKETNIVFDNKENAQVQSFDEITIKEPLFIFSEINKTTETLKKNNINSSISNTLQQQSSTALKTSKKAKRIKDSLAILRPIIYNPFKEKSPKTFKTGSVIVLEFMTSQKKMPYLYCSNSYGNTLVFPSSQKSQLYYKIPSYISNKQGIVNWQVFLNQKTLKGTFNILPKDSVVSMESYIGPPSINVGGKAHTMLVVIPTDDLDNPIKKNTLVTIKYQFLASTKTEQVFTKNLIAYDRIYSEEKKGRFLISSEALKRNSKELSIDAVPMVPKNFTISAKRHHTYADGNQITTFSTSVLKDKYNNVVSDGSYVTFFVKNKKGNILKTTGTSVKGVATAKMIHPDHEEEWTVKAYIDGVSNSNSITLTYTAVIKDFNVVFSENNRLITIGPLQSFMKQIMPDGLQVKLFVYKKNTLLKTFVKTSEKGFATFYLKTDIIENGLYNFKILTAGIKKTITDREISN